MSPTVISNSQSLFAQALVLCSDPMSAVLSWLRTIALLKLLMPATLSNPVGPSYGALLAALDCLSHVLALLTAYTNHNLSTLSGTRFHPLLGLF